MKKRVVSSAGVSPAIGVILMVAITVVLVGILYVWTYSLSEVAGDGVPDAYVLEVEDAAFKLDSPNASFSPGDQMISVTQTTGDQIDWADLRISLKVAGTDRSYEAAVLTISGSAYNPNNNSISKTGDIIILTPKGEELRSGMKVELTLIKDTNIVYNDDKPFEIK